MPAKPRKPKNRSGLTPAQRRLVAGVVERWAATVSGKTTPDLEMAEKCIRASYPVEQRDGIKVLFVRSPQMFFLLQAVCRGAISKKIAKVIAEQYGLKDVHLLDEVRRVAMQRNHTSERSQWYSQGNALVDVWSKTVAHVTREERIKRADVFNIELLGDEDEEEDSTVDPPITAEVIHDKRVEKREDHRARVAVNNFVFDGGNRARSFFDQTRLTDEGAAIATAWYSSGAHHAMLGQKQALSQTIDSTIYVKNAPGWASRYTDIIDREVMCRLLGVNDLSITWEHEIFHHVRHYMTFRTCALLLVGTPTLVHDEYYTLHNETGPAVEWEDGATLWYHDGHDLGRVGRKIVMCPETLTAEDVATTDNQEVRRIILDTLGWDKYLAGSGAYVLDKRENEVDNTVEILVAIPNHPKDAPKSFTEALALKDRRMVLACRSTGRKYCLNVSETINTCEEAQRWMAGGFVPSTTIRGISIPSPAMRIIGAS